MEDYMSDNVVVSSISSYRYFIKPMLKENIAKSYIFHDVDCFLYCETIDSFIKNGYKVKIMDFSSYRAGAVVEKGAYLPSVYFCRYNPFIHIKDENDIQTIVNCICIELVRRNKGKEDFIIKMSGILLRSVISYFQRVDKGNYCMNDIFGVFESVKVLDDFFDKVKTEYGEKSQEYSDYMVFCDFMKNEANMKECLAKLNNLFMFFKLDVFNNFTSGDDIDFNSVLEEKTVVFIEMPMAQRQIESSVLASIFLSQLVSFIAQNECKSIDSNDYKYTIAITLLGHPLDIIKINNLPYILSTLSNNILFSYSIKEDFEYLSEQTFFKNTLVTSFQTSYEIRDKIKEKMKEQIEAGYLTKKMDEYAKEIYENFEHMPYEVNLLINETGMVLFKKKYLFNLINFTEQKTCRNNIFKKGVFEKDILILRLK